MPGRSTRIGPILAVVLGAVGIAFLVVVLRPGSGEAPSQSATLQSYEKSVHALAVEVGGVIVQQIKPALADLVAGKISGDGFRSQAVQWRQVVEQVRSRGRGLSPPPGLQDAADLFDLSMQQYEEAIDTFVAASKQPAGQVAAAVDAAAPVADRADKTYDRFASLLNQALMRAGIPTPTALP